MLHAALLTPPTAAGIAVIRLQGSGVLGLLDDTFQPAAATDATVSPGSVRLGTIRDQSGVIDQVILTHLPDADALEINCHGGPRIVQRLLMLLRRHGVEILPWAQLLPADTIEQEVAHTLPHALTPLAVTALAAQHPTGLHQWTQRALAQLTENPESATQIRQQIETDLLPTYAQAQRLLTPAAVVIVGPTNAGKSTLANALAGRQQSIVADLPGATRDWTSQTIDLDGVPIELIDTAGHADTDDPLELAAILHAQQKLDHADLALLLLPAHDWREPFIEKISETLSHAPILVAAQADRVSKAELPPHAIPISVPNNTGLQDLRTAILKKLTMTPFNPHAPLVFTGRQQTLLQQAAQSTTPAQLQTILKELAPTA